MKRKKAPSYVNFRRKLRYNRLTGVFIRKGKIAGCLLNGYVVIQLDGVPYYAHHLAWYYVYGIWPEMLDHKDRNRSNNKLKNLREATHSQNRMNKEGLGIFKKSKLPKGVFACAHDPSKYRAKIQVNRTSIYLGQFNSVTKAKKAYITASKYFFGEYAAA